MTIYIVSGVMYAPDGNAKLAHGTCIQNTADAAVGYKTKEWLGSYPGYALEKILCSKLPENIYELDKNKSEEDMHVIAGDKIQT